MEPLADPGPRGGTRLLVATVSRMSQTARVSRSNATRIALELVRDDFAELLESVTEAEPAAPSAGTEWTNGQLLFHMWFGQRIARTLIPVFGGFSRLPARASIVWSRVLTALTTPYDRINYAGSVVGARITSPDAWRRRMSRDTDWLIRWCGTATETDLARGMSVPSDWDPYFAAWMSRADVLDWAPKHYRHHRGQLTLAATTGA